MPARSLLQISQKACIKDVKYLDNIGDFPLKINGAYGAIKPVLWAVERPDQLHRIEQTSPQIIGDDTELWIKFIQRDVDKYADLMPPHPKDPQNWYKLYKKLVKEHQADMAAQAAELEATMAGLRDAKQKNQVVSKAKEELPALPKLDGMQYLRLRDWNMAAVREKEKRAAERKKELACRGNQGSRTKNIFEKIRKEKRSACRSTMSTPTHLLHKNLAVNRGPALPQKHSHFDNTQRAPLPMQVPNTQKRGWNQYSEPKLNGTSVSLSSTPSGSSATHRAISQDPNKIEKPRMKTKAPADIFIPAKRRRVV